MKSKSTFWVKLLRFAAYFTIVCGCLLSLLAGCLFIFGADAEHRALGIVVGIAIILVGSLLSLLGSAAIMVYLDMANDVRAIRSRIDNGN